MCPPPDRESFLGAFLGQACSKDSFASKLSSPQLRDWGSLLTAGSETGALIQCLLNSAGLSRRQRMLGQGWRVWKTLTRYDVWSQEIKLLERGEEEKERKKSVPMKIFLLHFKPTTEFFKPHRIFQPLLLGALGNTKICHITPKNRQITIFSV